MARFLLASGAVLLALAVAMGAVSSHAAKAAAHPEAARLLQTAVLYQLVHGLGLVMVAILARAHPSAWLTASGLLLLGGILLFCGSLYFLAYTGRSLGPVAPLGGMSFIAGWLALAAFATGAAR